MSERLSDLMAAADSRLAGLDRYSVRVRPAALWGYVATPDCGPGSLMTIVGGPSYWRPTYAGALKRGRRTAARWTRRDERHAAERTEEAS